MEQDEIDRWGRLIAQSSMPAIPAPMGLESLIAALRNQRQIDLEGIDVGVSRQAVEEAIVALTGAAKPAQSKEATEAGMKFCCGIDERRCDEIAKLRNVVNSIFSGADPWDAWNLVMDNKIEKPARSATAAPVAWQAKNPHPNCEWFDVSKEVFDKKMHGAYEYRELYAAPQAAPVEETATDDELSAGVRAWFGDTDSPPVSRDFLERMRAAMLAARLFRMKSRSVGCDDASEPRK